MYHVAIVGATGLVGRTFLKVLEEFAFPVKELTLLASNKSEGTSILFKGKPINVKVLQENSFKGVDIALFSAGSDVSNMFAPFAVASGAIVIDNSSCFRNDEAIALVVPEVNMEDAKMSRIIANPNCSTIQAVLPLKALEDAFGLKSVRYTTYQATSGSGNKGIEELQRTLKGEEPKFYPHNISATCIPEIDVAMGNGYTKEEMKMVWETRKLLHRPQLKVSATCVRVPIANGHAVLIQAELDKSFSLEEVRTVLEKFPNIKVVDDLKNHQYPTSTLANNNDFVYVGRIRRDLVSENGILLYVVADNIRKGAASNAIQIALGMISLKLI